MSQTVITAGSGPSYSRWAFWPVWTKLLPLTHNCRVVDVSGPAAGNKFISRSVLTELSKTTPDLVLVQWNLGKYDIYSENPEFLQSVTKGSGIRNFIVDLHSCQTTVGPGYWCSSYDNTHPWKRYYNETIKSDAGTAMDDLESMLNLQNLCAKKNIPYRFFTHDTIDHEFFSNNINTRPFYNEIDWDCQLIDSVTELYQSHESKELHVEIPGHGNAVPNSRFQWYLLSQHISSKLAQFDISPRNNWEQIKNYCDTKATEIHDKYTKVQ